MPIRPLPAVRRTVPPILAFSILTLLVVAPTVRAGSFVPAGEMTAPRAGHSAIPLLDGRVFIVGGGPLTAEIYDPQSGLFTQVATLTHEAKGTRLADGRILIAGGFEAPSGPSARVDVYDPVANTLTATSPLLQAQFDLTATLLRDGRVLIAGGLYETTDSMGRFVDCTARAELYDPATGTSSFAGEYAGPIGAADEGVQASLLPDGRVLFVSNDSVQLYEPSTNSFTFVGTDGPLWFHAATELTDGEILFTPGEGDSGCGIGPDGPVLVYNPADATFSNAGAMIKALSWRLGCVLRDGTVLFAGGGGQSCDVSDTAELYLPLTRSFVPAGRMTRPRTLYAATPLPDGSVLITGGIESRQGLGWGPPIASAEIYRPAPPPQKRRTARH